MLTLFSDGESVMKTAYTFFTGLGVIVTGITLGFVAVAALIYRGRDSNDDDDDEELPYEQKYYEEFHNMETHELTETQILELSTRFLREETPSGEVVMCYNGETRTFQYWCDDKNIKFMVLDAVAQKFALENNVKAICVDYKEEYETALEIAKVVQEASDKEKTEEKKDRDDKSGQSVFAKFKNYNSTNEKTKIDAKTNKVAILTEKCNRFKRCGSISEWNAERNVEDEASAGAVREPELSVSEWLRERRAAASASSHDSAN
jgi:hypothetical protein